MKRQFNFKLLRYLFIFCCVLLAVIGQQEIIHSFVSAKTNSTPVYFSDESDQQTSPCSCVDKKDILYRIREANAAIAEYKNQIKNYQSQETDGGKPTIYSQNEYRNVLQPALQTAVNLVYQSEPAPKAKTATGGTDAHSCNLTINGGSPCLREAVKRHETHHSNSCSLKNPAGLDPSSDYRDGMKMIDVIQEEITAYTLEIAYLVSEYSKFPDSCKQNWFLSYSVEVRFHSPLSKSNNKEPGKSSITWDIDRSYSAKNLELSPTTSVPATPLVLPDMTNMTQQQRIQAAMEAVQNQAKQPTPKTTRKYWSHQPAVNYPSGYVPLEININDKLVDYLYEECKGKPLDYIMTTERTKTWEGRGQDGTQNKFRFEADLTAKTYNITIPVVPMISYLTPVKVEEKTVVDQTILKPPHTETTKPTQKMSFQAMGMPTVKGLLENAEIHHSTDQTLTVTLDMVTFDSGWLKASDVFKGDYASLNGKLEAKVFYVLSKVPAN
ncbi:MAG TPA: hypothetical protein PKY82_23725 [Pyrinomonadaceae bacterium]|nr:hypothetical protein [Pyrinomonadaceae bacterium]